MKLKTFTFAGPFIENTYVFYNEETKNALVIDPGMISDNEVDEFDSFISENNLVIKKVLLTHCHIDHCCGASHVQEQYGAKVIAHKDEKYNSDNLLRQAMMFGVNKMVSLAVNEYLCDEEEMEFEQLVISALHTPGHSEGGVVYYIKDLNLAFCGDTIFKRSLGRCDLPGGSWDSLSDSIYEKIFSLPEETVLYCGHGPSTTVLLEKKFNPYL